MDDAMRVLSGMADIGSIGGESVTLIPTEGLAWGGWLIDTLMNYLPINLVPQLLTYLAIFIGFGLITRKNSLEISDGKYSYAKTIYGATLFTIATYFMLAATSTVFLYFNF